MLIFPHMPDIGILVLRIILGLTFIYHGWPKIKDPHAYGEMLFQGSPTFALFLAIGEFFGGLALLVGFMTEIMALLFLAINCGAIYYKIHHWKRKFHATAQTGWEYDFVLAGVAVAIILLGAGMYSVDAYFGLFI